MYKGKNHKIALWVWCEHPEKGQREFSMGVAIVVALICGHFFWAVRQIRVLYIYVPVSDRLYT